MVEEFVQVSTTVERREDGARIAGALVEERLAACVQVVGPISSTYRWQGVVERSEEWLLLVKTKRDLYGMVEEVICGLHPYEVPEVIAVPLILGSSDYLGWMRAELLDE